MDLVNMLLIGLLGSGHCIGMCGGFAVTIGAACPKLGPALVHQLVYGAGRLFTYGFLGALAGVIGARLARVNLPLIGAQQALSIVAGVVMLYIGASALGLIRFRRLAAAGDGWLSASLRQFINSRGLGPFLLAGVFTGFLPCGLVYAALAQALTTTDPLRGWLGMICFGAGTIPAMTVIGCGGSLLSRTMRTRILKLAACFVVLLGGVTIYRGLPIKESCCAAGGAAGQSAAGSAESAGPTTTDRP